MRLRWRPRFGAVTLLWSETSQFRHGCRAGLDRRGAGRRRDADELCPGRAPHDPAPWRSVHRGRAAAACLSGRQQLSQLSTGALSARVDAPARRSRRPRDQRQARPLGRSQTPTGACRGDGLFEDDPGTARFADRAAGGVKHRIRRGPSRPLRPRPPVNIAQMISVNNHRSDLHTRSPLRFASTTTQLPPAVVDDDDAAGSSSTTTAINSYRCLFDTLWNLTRRASHVDRVQTA